MYLGQSFDCSVTGGYADEHPINRWVGRIGPSRSKRAPSDVHFTPCSPPHDPRSRSYPCRHSKSAPEPSITKKPDPRTADRWCSYTDTGWAARCGARSANASPALGLRCIAPTWPMGGHSQPLRPGADRTITGVAGIVAEVLTALDLQDVVLVGNDSGGVITQLVAVHHPERLGALVLTSCDAFENFPPPILAPVLLAAKSKTLFRIATQGMRLAVSASVRTAACRTMTSTISRDNGYGRRCRIRRSLKTCVSSLSRSAPRSPLASPPGYPSSTSLPSLPGRRMTCSFRSRMANGWQRPFPMPGSR